MPAYDFGQPKGGVIQMAYIVPDIRAAMEHWVRELKVGPWFQIERILGDNPTYRGAPSTSEVSMALAYSGSMMFELIQPLDDNPSVFKEVIEKRGYGFHHVGLATHDFEGDLKAHQAQGREVAFRTGVPTGGSVGYIDMGDSVPGFIELIEVSEQAEAFFTSFYRASVGWDGSDPIRALG